MHEWRGVVNAQAVKREEEEEREGEIEEEKEARWNEVAYTVSEVGRERERGHMNVIFLFHCQGREKKEENKREDESKNVWMWE